MITGLFICERELKMNIEAIRRFAVNRALSLFIAAFMVFGMPVFTAIQPALAGDAVVSSGTCTVSGGSTDTGVQGKIKAFVDKNIRSDETLSYKLPGWLEKFYGRAKSMLPDKIGTKLEEKKEYYTDRETLKKEGLIKGVAIAGAMVLGGALAGVGALVGMATCNPVGIGMGAYIGWRLGRTIGGVFTNHITRSLVEETLNKESPDYKTTLKSQPWGRITTEGVAAGAGSLTGEFLGAYIGATVGATMGTFTFPIVGTIAGAVVGGWVGKKVLAPLFKFIAVKATTKSYNKLAGPEGVTTETGVSPISAVSPGVMVVGGASDANALAVLRDRETQLASRMDAFETLMAEGRMAEAQEEYTLRVKPLRDEVSVLRQAIGAGTDAFIFTPAVDPR